MPEIHGFPGMDTGECAAGDYYFLGQKPAAGISIVGTRNPSAEAIRITRHFTARLRAFGFSHISGLARGIDAHGHQTALRMSIPSIAVLPAGPENIIPIHHRQLASAMLNAKGTILSPWPPGTTPSRWRFVVRNRWIAALSCGVIVVETGLNGGALHAARAARLFGRLVATVELRGHVPDGNLWLIDHGARSLRTISDLDGFLKECRTAM